MMGEEHTGATMNTWQERFAQKLDNVREAADDFFQRFCGETLDVVFEEFCDFTSQRGLAGSAPLSKASVRTFKFEMSENAYVLITFRSCDLEHCEVMSELSIPRHEKISPAKNRVEVGDADNSWARRMFEEALDAFADALTASYTKLANPSAEMIHA